MTPAQLFDALAIPIGALLYVQSSADWLARAGFSAVDTLAALQDRTAGTGTLVMPSYPFHGTHRDYLETTPVFDVVRTPSAVGLLPEMFRRTKGVRRSLDPDFCVSAFGQAADDIVGVAPAAPDPFGADSSYQRMLDRHCTLIGLGVSLNTHSFIHVIDSRAEPGYPLPVYDDRVFSASLIDGRGERRTIERKALRPEFQQRTRPAQINETMRPGAQAFCMTEISGAHFFKWDLDAWSAWCLEHAREQASRSEWPCWLTGIGE